MWAATSASRVIQQGSGRRAMWFIVHHSQSE